MERSSPEVQRVQQAGIYFLYFFQYLLIFFFFKFCLIDNVGLVVWMIGFVRFLIEDYGSGLVFPLM